MKIACLALPLPLREGVRGRGRSRKREPLILFSREFPMGTFVPIINHENRRRQGLGYKVTLEEVNSAA